MDRLEEIGTFTECRGRQRRRPPHYLDVAHQIHRELPTTPSRRSSVRPESGPPPRNKLREKPIRQVARRASHRDSEAGEAAATAHEGDPGAGEQADHRADRRPPRSSKLPEKWSTPLKATDCPYRGLWWADATAHHRRADALLPPRSARPAATSSTGCTTHLHADDGPKHVAAKDFISLPGFVPGVPPLLRMGPRRQRLPAHPGRRRSPVSAHDLESTTRRGPAALFAADAVLVGPVPQDGRHHRRRIDRHGRAHQRGSVAERPVYHDCW